MAPRMRTCKQCIEELKKEDPNTAVTEHYLRKLIREDEVVHVRSGRRLLVNFDNLLQYLNSPNGSEKTAPIFNNIRRINA